MNIEELKKLMKSVMATTGKVCIPWKLNFGETEEYRRGWNDCVKQAKKNRAKYLKEMTKLL